jgi:hypothetical protein
LLREPIKIIYVKVQKQYTVNKQQAIVMSPDEKQTLVSIPVRFMSTVPHPTNTNQVYVVAKDVCCLVHKRNRQYK